jgi:hypothetical protein
MVLLCDEARLEDHFSPFRDRANLDVSSMHGLCQTYHRPRNHFVHIRWYSSVTRLNWKLVSVRLEIVLILTQDRCNVCAKRTIGSEIILDEPDATPR